MKTRQWGNPNAAVLRRWPGLSGCTPRELEQLATVVDQVTLEPGRVLMRAGERGGEAFMIVSGRVEVEVGGQVVATVGPESFVGEMALLDHDVRSATVTVVEPTRALVLTPRVFRTVIAKPGVSARLATELAQRIRQLEGSTPSGA
jgi:CRP-like cAMP-binding protein